MARLALAAVILAAAVLVSATAAQNTAPSLPVISEPSFNGQLVNPQDVHMETNPFADANASDTHAASDWEIWRITPSERVWAALGVTGVEKIHAHFGDGVFMGSLAGQTQLTEQASYQLKVRHKDSSGDAATEWSAYATRLFTTVASGQRYALELDDVAADPVPFWLGPGGTPIDLPSGAIAPSLRVESNGSLLLLRVDASAGAGNALTNPAPIANHDPVRVVIDAGNLGANLVLPESELVVVHHDCEATRILLPAVNLAPGLLAYYWVAADGATYVGTAGQTTPTFTQSARGLIPPWVPRQPGYSVEVVASGFKLPVNIAFVPNPGAAPGDPRFYVTELYGTIKYVANDGTVGTYASNLLDFTPTGAFPGNGEQGLTGLAIDPVSGDVFAAILRDQPGAGTEHEPRILRFHSNDGGRTAATETTILYMAGEFQGQSHQISRLEIVDGKLFCHVGDGFTASTARNLASYRGKILRLELDGTPVTTNPFYAAPTITARDYVYAYGVRNPFGGAWRASDGFRYVVENGPSVDRFARIVAGRDYLWAGSDANMANFALYNWNPSSGPVNLAFVQPQTFGGSGFPASKQDHAFVTESGATYAQGQQAIGKKITEWVLDANGNRVSGPVTFVEYVGDGRATCVGLAAGPDGLYFTELYKDLGTSVPADAGARILRVRYGSSSDCNQNGDPDWCDIATAASTDFDLNAVPDECDRLSEDVTSISLSAGGTCAFTLNAGAVFAGKTYFVLGSASGTAPGIALQGGAVLPLNAASDAWFMLTLLNPNTAVLPGTLGTLDGSGRGSAALVLPPGTPAILAGLALHHAYVVHDGVGAFIAASNAVPLALVP